MQPSEPSDAPYLIRDQVRVWRRDHRGLVVLVLLLITAGVGVLAASATEPTDSPTSVGALVTPFLLAVAASYVVAALIGHMSTARTRYPKDLLGVGGEIIRTLRAGSGSGLGLLTSGAVGMLVAAIIHPVLALALGLVGVASAASIVGVGAGAVLAAGIAAARRASGTTSRIDGQSVRAMLLAGALGTLAIGALRIATGASPDCATVEALDLGLNCAGSFGPLRTVLAAGGAALTAPLGLSLGAVIGLTQHQVAGLEAPTAPPLQTPIGGPTATGGLARPRPLADQDEDVWFDDLLREPPDTDIAGAQTRDADEADVDAAVEAQEEAHPRDAEPPPAEGAHDEFELDAPEEADDGEIVHEAPIVDGEATAEAPDPDPDDTLQDPTDEVPVIADAAPLEDAPSDEAPDPDPDDTLQDPTDEVPVIADAPLLEDAPAEDDPIVEEQPEQTSMTSEVSAPAVLFDEEDPEDLFEDLLLDEPGVPADGARDDDVLASSREDPPAPEDPTHADEEPPADVLETDAEQVEPDEDAAAPELSAEQEHDADEPLSVDAPAPVDTWEPVDTSDPADPSRAVEEPVDESVQIAVHRQLTDVLPRLGEETHGYLAEVMVAFGQPAPENGNLAAALGAHVDAAEPGQIEQVVTRLRGGRSMFTALRSEYARSPGIARSAIERTAVSSLQSAGLDHELAERVSSMLLQIDSEDWHELTTALDRIPTS